MESEKIGNISEYYIIMEVIKTIVGGWIYFFILYWEYDEDNYNLEEKASAKMFLELNLIGLINLIIFII